MVNYFGVFEKPKVCFVRRLMWREVIVFSGCLTFVLSETKGGRRGSCFSQYPGGRGHVSPGDHRRAQHQGNKKKEATFELVDLHTAKINIRGAIDSNARWYRQNTSSDLSGENRRSLTSWQAKTTQPVGKLAWKISNREQEHIVPKLVNYIGIEEGVPGGVDPPHFWPPCPAWIAT